VESTVDSLELASGDEALQHLVDGRAIAEVEEIDGRPHVGRRAVLDALDDRRLEVAHGQWLRSTSRQVGTASFGTSGRPLPSLEAQSETIPAEELEDLQSLVVLNEPASLASGDADDGCVGFIEALQDCSHSSNERVVQEHTAVEAEKVCAGVLVGHTFRAVLDTVAPVVVFKVVLQTVEHATKILGGLPIAERHQLEERVGAATALAAASGRRLSRLERHGAQREQTRPC